MYNTLNNFMNIAEKLSAIQVEFKADKSRKNNFGNYNYRSAEDVLEAVKPLLVKYKCAITLTERLVEFSNTPTVPKMVAGKDAGVIFTAVPVIESKATLIDAENSDQDSMSAIHATALVGVDFNQKGMQTPQAFGAASSYGKKYALGNLLLIDDTKDADATNTHGRATTTKAAPSKAKTTTKADTLPWEN